MSYKKGGFPYYSFNPIGFRSRGSKPPFFSDLIQWACGNPVAVDGETYIQDKKNNSGVAQGRDEVLGAYFDGTNSPWILFTATRNIETSHVVEFEMIPQGSANRIIGNSSSASSYVGEASGSVLRYRNNAENLDWSIVSDGLKHKYKFERNNNNVRFFIDEVEQLPSKNLTSGTDFIYDSVFNNTSNVPVNTKFYWVCIAGLETYFQSTNSDTKVQFFNRTTGEVVIGEIQSPTLNDLVSTTDYPSDMNDNGYTLARALEKNLFNGDLAQFGFFVDSNGDIQSSGSANWLSSPILVEPNTEYTVKSISNMGRGVSYDEDGNKIGLIFDQLPSSDTKTFTTQSNAKTIVFHIQTSTTENVQLELGNTPTAYEPWVGYYYDSALTLPVPDGTLGYNVNGKTTFFTAASTPEYASSEFVGGLKADIRVIDGIIDQLGWVPKVNDEPNVMIDGRIQTFLGGMGSTVNSEKENNVLLKDNTLYTVVINIISTTLTGNSFALASSGAPVSAVFFNNATSTGERRKVFTTENPITDNLLSFALTSAATPGQDIQIEFIGIYEGDYVTGSPPLPTGAVVGNSWIQHTRRYDLIQTDKLTTTEQYDQSDKDNVFALPVEITGPVSDNPFFLQTDPWCLLQYDRVLDPQEEIKVELYQNF